MARQFEPDKDASDEVRRVASEELAQAVEFLTTKELDLDTAVHEARKRIKRLRALLRLVRGELGAVFDAVNSELRSTARRLASAREAAATLEAIDQLKEELGDRVPEAVFAAARETFSGRTPSRASLGSLLETSAQNLDWVRKAIDGSRARRQRLRPAEAGLSPYVSHRAPAAARGDQEPHRRGFSRAPEGREGSPTPAPFRRACVARAPHPAA